MKLKLEFEVEVSSAVASTETALEHVATAGLLAVAERGLQTLYPEESGIDLNDYSITVTRID